MRKSIQRIAAFVAKWKQRDRVSSVVRLGHAIRWFRALSTFTLWLLYTPPERLRGLTRTRAT